MTAKTARLWIRLENEVKPHIKQFESASQKEQERAEELMTEWAGSAKTCRRWSRWFRMITRRMDEMSDGFRVHSSDIPTPPETTSELKRNIEETEDETARTAAIAWVKAAKIVLEESVYTN